MKKLTEERLKNIFNKLVEELDLNYGNAGHHYFSERTGRFGGYIEGPKNTFLTIKINFNLNEEMTDEEIEEKFLNNIKKTINDFDLKSIFYKIWLVEFGFVDAIGEDYKFFKNKALEI